MYRRLPSISAAVAVALLAVVAVAPAATAAPGVPATGKSSDAAIARAGLLRLSDFPSGWKQTRHKDSKPTGLASCKGTEQVTANNKKYRAQSPDFNQGATMYAENSVYVFPKESQATAFLEPYQAAAAGTCLQQGTQRALKKIKGATVQVQPLDLSSALQSGTVDDAVGYEVLATVPGSTQPAQLYLVAIATRIGRSVAGFTTENQGEPLAETTSLINASLTRLTQALG